MESGAKCGCNHSLAVICGAFAGIAVVLYLAQDICLDRGGRLSDAAWTCETASGVASLWGLLTPGIALLALVAGTAVYFAASFAGRRWLFRYARQQQWRQQDE